MITIKVEEEDYRSEFALGSDLCCEDVIFQMYAALISATYREESILREMKEFAESRLDSRGEDDEL